MCIRDRWNSCANNLVVYYRNLHLDFCTLKWLCFCLSRLYILSPFCRLSSVYYRSVWSEINKLIDWLNRKIFCNGVARKFFPVSKSRESPFSFPSLFSSFIVSCPHLSFLFSSCRFPFLLCFFFLFLAVEILATGSAGVSWAPPVGSTAEPQPKSNLERHSLKIRAALHLILRSRSSKISLNYVYLAIEES